MFSTNWESGGLGKWSLNNTDIMGTGVADFRLPIADLVFGFWALVFESRNRPNRQLAIGNRQWSHSNCFLNCSNCCRRSEEHTSELQSRLHLVCRLLLEKKK